MIDRETKLCIRCNVSSTSLSNSISTLNKSKKYSNLFSKYPDMLNPNLLISNTKHDIKHFILKVFSTVQVDLYILKLINLTKNV